jgi:hypothetical protein
MNDRIQALLRMSSSSQQQQPQQGDLLDSDATTGSSSWSSNAQQSPPSSSSSSEFIQSLPQVAMLSATERAATLQEGSSTAHNVLHMLHPTNSEQLRSAVASVAAARLEARARVVQRRTNSGKVMARMRAETANS